jgi:uncharacterized protein (DUF58 family)
MAISLEHLLSKVRLLHLRSKKLSTDMLGGDNSTSLKGRGMSFSEVREYQYGDDVRTIDWNVSARFNHPYIKLFEVEREMSVMLLIDISASTLFGTHGRSKQELVAELVATVAFSAARNNDKVGAVFFAEDVVQYFAPQKGRSHILRILNALLKIDATQYKASNVAKAYQSLTHMVKHRCMAFTISDMLCADYAQALALAARKHDVVGLHVYDIADKELPNIGMAHVQDLETQKILVVNTANADVRKKYTDHFLKQLETIKQTYSASGARCCSINTADDFTAQLQHFFSGKYA